MIWTEDDEHPEMPKLWDEAEGKQCCETIVGPVGLAGVTLILVTKDLVPAGMAAINPSAQQKVPPSEGQWQPEKLSSWGIARGEFSRACAPSSATVYAFQPPQVFKEEPSSTNVPNESVKEQL